MGTGTKSAGLHRFTDFNMKAALLLVLGLGLAAASPMNRFQYRSKIAHKTSKTDSSLEDLLRIIEKKRLTKDRPIGERPAGGKGDGEKPTRPDGGEKPTRPDFSGERPPRPDFSGERPPRPDFSGERPPHPDFSGDLPIAIPDIIEVLEELKRELRGRPEGGKSKGGKPEGGKPEGGKPEGGKPDFSGEEPPRPDFSGEKPPRPDFSGEKPERTIKSYNALADELMAVLAQARKG